MEKKVVDILKRTSKGESIAEVVSESELPRSYIGISLVKLEGAKKVSMRKVGMVKVYQLIEGNSHGK